MALLKYLGMSPAILTPSKILRPTVQQLPQKPYVAQRPNNIIIPKQKGPYIVQRPNDIVIVGQKFKKFISTTIFQLTQCLLQRVHHNPINLSVHQAKEVNRTFPSCFADPYSQNTLVWELNLPRNTDYSRVFGFNPYGPWIFEANAVNGLTLNQVLERYALPFPPSTFMTWTVLEGTKVRVGLVAPNFGYAGQAYQTQMLLSEREIQYNTRVRSMSHISQNGHIF